MIDTPLASLAGVSAGYRRGTVLSQVDLTIPAAQVTALVGVNGSGKTTLLRVLLGLLPPRAGQVQRPAAGVGYVPQIDRSEGLMPVTAEQVVMMGLTPALGAVRGPTRTDRQAVLTALEHFGAADLAPHLFGALSGGQRQRVLLSRALVARPSMLVLDEPVRGLDLGSSAALVTRLRSLAHDEGLGVVVATHSLDLVANHADQVALFKHGRVRAGAAEQIFTDTVLGEHFGCAVHVGEVAGHRVVVPGKAL